ncbi:ABC transporter permease [Haematobacter massiliensis]|uniref:ABC transporter permease n=1 Tax=Haematobacter massiliensis TaxID=195105 RepID=A0A086Y292_9RHOB|nr:branched-chain amino acid ABC transporter permease [Haematobacter massiliensis]KFI28392.1 ABC transporter permease [Haematobacter massiliensis]OWJ84739.1 branched-chain amino acid ABC transporter permease [Haematobacter massiliensis]QBJ26368.1 branched-chain amino acid ABC transporter permease [Haematobacter massiliensis]
MTETTLASITPPMEEPLPGRPRDFVPLLVILALMALTFPLVGDLPSWGTLTVAALAMGMMLFLMASGLTLVFGLMDVMNLGHAAFVAFGAYVATSLTLPVEPLLLSPSPWANAAGLAIIALAAMAATALMGLVFERLFIRPAGGNHLKEILVTIGAMIIIEQLLVVFWGPNQMWLQLPFSLQGSVILGDMFIEKYRIAACLLGLVVFAGLMLLLSRTRLGLLIRAGVEDREMVEALGYRINTLFVLVFAGGAALAGLGGAMWGFYREIFTLTIGAEVLVQLLIIVIMGGLGSLPGCFAASILVALSTNYVGYLAPDFAMVANVAMMLAVLLWRPRGLYPLNG